MRDKLPAVSVCVPTYNYGRFLADCLESVLNQTLSDWELIISDDCSSDNTQEIAAQYVQRDSRIVYLRNPKRFGMNANVKKAAEAGRGRYLKMLCSDDWLASECLEKLYDLMEQNSSAALATSAEFLTTESRQPLKKQFLFGADVSKIPGRQMLNRMARGSGLGGHSSFFIRSDAYRAVGGYDDSLLYAADLDLAARLCRVGDYLHTDQPLFYGRSHGLSSSSVNPAKLLDVIDSFTIPDKVFQPRRFPDLEWRRYQLMTARLTARYVVNSFLQQIRGQNSYARELRSLLKKQGNFRFGIPLLAFHIPFRLFNRVTGRSRPISAKTVNNLQTPNTFRHTNA